MPDILAYNPHVFFGLVGLASVVAGISYMIQRRREFNAGRTEKSDDKSEK